MTRSVRQSTWSRRVLYQAVGDLLTASSGLPDFSEDHWKVIIRFSGDALIAAQLYERLGSSGLLSQPPEEIRLYLHEVYELNATRSLGLVDTFTRFTKNLNRAGVNPIAIKGISLLIGEMPGEPLRSSRITYDVDVLIRADELLPSLKALKTSGYRQIVSPIFGMSEGDGDSLLGQIDLADFRNDLSYARSHVPPVVDDEKICIIEVHLAAATLNNPRAKILTNMIFNQSVLVVDDAKGITYSIPDPVAQLVLAVYHAHIKNSHQLLGCVDWRLLLDMSAISQVYLQTDLVAETMRVSEKMRMNREMYTAWALLVRYLKVDLDLEAVETTEHRRALYWFDRKCEWRLLAWCCEAWLQIRKAYTLLSPREVRQSLGPQMNLSNLLAHLSYRIRRSMKS